MWLFNGNEHQRDHIRTGFLFPWPASTRMGVNRNEYQPSCSLSLPVMDHALLDIYNYRGEECEVERILS